MQHLPKKYDDLELRRHGVAGASIYTSLIMNSMSGGGGNVAPSITGVPTISGDTDVGDLLTATAASVTGIPTPVRTWQWTRNGVDISGATNTTYTIQAADDGTAIRVRQIETNSEGSDTATSDPVSVVDVFAPTISGVPTISGTTGEGDTLTASPASVTGVPTPTRTWQWYRDAVAISGATSITYTLVSADLGTDITVVQTETNSEGTDTATSAATSIPSAPASATAMRVRESVGNAEADIPLAVDGYVDETALTTHTGAASAFVSVWHDQSGNDNDATQVTQTAQPRIVNAGTVDEALVFDGSNDFLTLTSPLSFAGEFTLAVWAKRDTTNSFDAFFGNANGIGIDWNYFIFWNNSTQCTVAINGISSSVNHNVNTGDWHHYAMSRDVNDKINLYVDGVFVARMFSDEPRAGTTHWNLVGDSRNLFFDGSLDQAYAANVALSEAQIAALMNGTLPASGTVLWLKAKEQPPVYAMRVRESGANAEADILVDDSGYVDETRLLAHVGANSGFVTSWQDRSGLGNHAVQTTQVSQPRIVNAGTVDEALVFDGTNDFLTLTTPLSFAGEFTLACWAKRNDGVLNPFFGGVSFGYEFGFWDLNQIGVRDNGTWSTFNHGVTSDNWNFYAITRDSLNVYSFFVNGLFVSSLFSGAPRAGSAGYEFIARRNDGNLQKFNGLLDQAYAANVALSEAQIAALMNGTLPASGTVLYLKAKDVAP